MNNLSNFLGSYQFYLKEQRKPNPDQEKLDASFEMCRASLAAIPEDVIDQIYSEPIFSNVVSYIRTLEDKKRSMLKAEAV